MHCVGNPVWDWLQFLCSIFGSWSSRWYLALWLGSNLFEYQAQCNLRSLPWYSIDGVYYYHDSRQSGIFMFSGYWEIAIFGFTKKSCYKFCSYRLWPTLRSMVVLRTARILCRVGFLFSFQSISFNILWFPQTS